MIVRSLALIVATVVTALLQPAGAQTWPTRPITLVVPFPPGAASDILARIIAEPLGKELGVPVIVENTPGSGGMIGIARVKNAQPDGNTLGLLGIDTGAMNNSLYKRPLYAVQTDLMPISLWTEQPLVLIVRNELPIRNVAEFLSYLKANAAKMQYGSAGVGSGSHLACANMFSKVSANVLHVPYKGAPDVYRDMIGRGGQIDVMCSLAAGAVPFIKEKQLRAIAMMAPQRSPLIPDLPTAEEQGLPGVDVVFWSGLVAPAKTPSAVLARLNEASIRALATPGLDRKLQVAGVTIVDTGQRSAQALAAAIKKDGERWAKIIKEQGIQIE